ncbi:15044_t:CDS:1, partial [Dentiscutata erythropus]
MRSIYIHLKSLLILFAFILQNCLIVNSQFEPLASFWGVPTKQIPELLNREKNLIIIDSKLQLLLDNSSFGGTYIDVIADQININTVDPSKIDGVKNSLKQFQTHLNFIRVNNSLSQLNFNFNQIVKLSQNFSLTNSIIGIEPEVNDVVIYLDDKDEKNKEFIDSVNFLNPKINPLPKEETIFNPSNLIKKRRINLIHPIVFGGSKIVGFFRSSLTNCSAGFWMKKDNKDFILTAGHCTSSIPPPATFYLEDKEHIIGPMNDFSFEPNDMGFIEHLDNSIVQLRPIIRNFDSESSEILNYFVIDSSDITSIGIHVCKSGHVTGITCGKVIAINAESRTQTGTKKGVFRVSMNFDNGDSGGAIYRYNNGDNPSLFVDAVGIFISGSNSAVGEPIRKALDS